ncbi:MAG: D-amino-acid transaminase [Alphaproteobacteria bacterium]
MSRVAYVNGRYLSHADAMVHVEDRGYQFADGVYEVIFVTNGRLVDELPHLERLERSLGELRMEMPMSTDPMRRVMREVLRRNRLRDGLLYIQVTRGVAPRDHRFPAAAKPALVMTARRPRPQSPKLTERGVDVITLPDIRWARCDIKSVSLLPNVLGRQQAAEAGAYEAWQVGRDGLVTEGTASNAWIVTDDGRLITPDATAAILNGITRRAILRLADEEGLKLEERRFSVEEAHAAREAFLTSTSSFVVPVTRIDGRPVADGRPGVVTRWLREAYDTYMRGSANGGPASK